VNIRTAVRRHRRRKAHKDVSKKDSRRMGLIRSRRRYAVAAGFVVNLGYRTLEDDVEVAKQRIAAAKSILLNNVLPAILATDVAETEPLE
jgi:hypothetical protein